MSDRIQPRELWQIINEKVLIASVQESRWGDALHEALKHPNEQNHEGVKAIANQNLQKMNDRIIFTLLFSKLLEFEDPCFKYKMIDVVALMLCNVI